MFTADAPPKVSSPATPSPVNGGDRLPKSLDALTEKRRGTPSGTKRGPYKRQAGGADNAGAADPLANLPSPQFTPETCKYLVEFPFNLGFVRTGFTGFLLSEAESAALSASAATVLNTWVRVDPKWVALMMFSVSLTSISATKVMAYRVALAEIEARKNPATDTAPPSGSGGEVKQ